MTRAARPCVIRGESRSRLQVEDAIMLVNGKWVADWQPVPGITVKGNQPFAEP